MKATIKEIGGNGVIWCDVDGTEYGLADDGTLMEIDEYGCASNCDCISVC